MKKHALFTTFLLTSGLLLGACNSPDEVLKDKSRDDTLTNQQKDETVDESNLNESMEEKYGFRYILLDIGTEEEVNILHVMIDEDNDETKAAYKNTKASTNLQGDAAYTLLEPKLVEMKLDKDMRETEVIELVTKTFEIDDFSTVEMEVEFADGDNQIYSQTSAE